jgi:hypothetical protein
MVFRLPQKKLLMKVVALDNDVVAASPLEAIQKFGGKV